jgi:TonB family protein
MRVPNGGYFGGRPVMGVGASILLHVLLALVVVWLGMPARLPDVKRGEPLIVELPNIPEPAPRGNPSAREPGPPVSEPRVKPIPPARPAPAARSAPPVVAKAPPPPVARNVPSPPDAQTRPAEPEPKAPAPERTASRTTEPSTSGPKPEDNTPDGSKPAAPTSAVAKNETSTPESAPAQPSDTRTAMAPSPGSTPAPDLRAALRRGGGAGGLTGGRGGIEGEPIPLDSQDPRYSDYLERVRRKIQGNWSYPCMKNPVTHVCEHKGAQLIVEFGILKDGRVQFVELRQSSGFEIYDDYAINAIKLSSPFPDVPPAMILGMKRGSTGIAIVAHFHYILETSFRGVLR